VEPDASLRRVERTAVLVCLGMALVALLLPGGGVRAALAVLGGGLISAVSYGTIHVAVTALATGLAGSRAGEPSGDAAEAAQPVTRSSSLPGRPARKPPWVLVRVGLRYALLALLAYVMIARLRLHPVGLLAGVSSVVAAVSLEALRLLLKKS
jgi:hypothetical protein